MKRFGYAVAGLVGLGITYIGTRYLLEPDEVARTFGVPDVPPAGDPFLHVKGVRDIGSGLVVLALMATCRPRAVAVAMLAEAVVPAGDMVVVLRHGGSRAVALGVHGATAAAMVVAAVALLRASGDEETPAVGTAVAAG